MAPMSATPTSASGTSGPVSSRSPLTSARQTPLHYLPKLRRISQHSPSPSVPSQPIRASPSSDALGCNEEINDEPDRDDEEEEEEEEAECSAPQCKKPIADQISWVQCDRCQEWFHCICVGLTKEYAEKIDKYNCKKCLVLRQQGASEQSVSGGGGGGGGARIRTVQSKSQPAPSDARLNSQNLMKGLLQNPQLAAQLLTNLPFKQPS